MTGSNPDQPAFEKGGALPGTTGAGESGGGPYPNPHTGKKPKDGFLGHGGQTDIFEKPVSAPSDKKPMDD